MVTPRPVKLQNVDRFTTTFAAHFEHRGEPPVSVSKVCQVALSTLGIEPYQRRQTATSDPQPLDLGWVRPEQVGFIVIENLEGLGRQEYPSEEERADIARRVIEIDCGSNSGCWLVEPGLYFFGKPVNSTSIKIRCRYKTATYKVHIFPK